MFVVEKKNEIAILRMQYGPANAMDLNFCLELTKQVQQLADSSYRAIVLTGQGKIFCAGVDLPQLLEGGVAYVRKFLPALDEVFETLFFCPKPVVAAVNGHAIAGGCLLACCADRRLMAAGKARIGVPELLVGVPFPTVPLEIMRARTASSFFEEVVLGGATYDPDGALHRGLIDRVVDSEPLLDEAITLAQSLAEIRPEIYALTKKQTRQPVQDAIVAGAKMQEAEIVALWESPETYAAVQSFVSRTLKK